MVARTKGKPARRWAPLLGWLCAAWLACASSALALEIDPGVRLEAATQRAQAGEQSAMGWRLAIATFGLVLVAIPLLSELSELREFGKPAVRFEPGR